MTRERSGSASRPNQFRHVRLIVVLACVFLFATRLSAFKPKTHIWVAQQILNEVLTDGTVTIKGAKYRVRPELLLALTKYPNAYRLGSVGPDAFPDMVVGQMTAHPGLEQHWGTDGWLRHLIRSSEAIADPLTKHEALAFAYGYVAHAATDIFAHSYVNTYTGDIFLLTDGDQTVEIRHVALETYIDSKTPELVDESGRPLGEIGKLIFVTPRLISDLLVMNDAVSDQYRDPLALGPHLALMYGEKRLVDEALKEVHKIKDGLSKPLDDLQRLKQQIQLEFDRFTSPIVNVQRDLATARLALDGHKQLIDAQQKIVDEQTKIIEDGQREVQAARDRLPNLPRAISGAESILDGARKAVEGIASDACDAVFNLLGDLTGYKGPCDDLKNAQTKRDEAQKILVSLRDEKSRLEARIAELPKQIDAAGPLREAARLKKLQLEQARDLDDSAQKTIDRLTPILNDLEAKRADVARRLADIDRNLTGLSGLQSLTVEGLEFALSNWGSDIARAVDKYMEASTQVARALAQSEGNLIEPYTRWHACYGPVFSGVPAVIGDATCAVRDSLKDVQDDLAALRKGVDDFLGDAAWVVDPMGKLQELIRKDLVPLAKDEAATVIGKTIGHELESLVRILDDGAKEDRLVTIFTEDQSGKNLLKIANIVERVNADMGLEAGEESFSENGFAAAHNAVVLAKLALLDASELNRFVVNQKPKYNNGMQRTQVGPNALYDQKTFVNVLVDAVRSIDGSHQWNEYAAPYQRRSGAADTRPRGTRRYGYGKPKGLLLWSDLSVRSTVFGPIFIGPFVPGLEEPDKFRFEDIVPPEYPYRPTAKTPFPSIR